MVKFEDHFPKLLETIEKNSYEKGTEIYNQIIS